MKKLTMFLLAAALFTACGADNGAPAPDAGSIPEGSGAALDLSGSSSGNTTDTEVFVKSTLDSVDASLRYATSSSGSSVSGGAAVKSISVSDIRQGCANGSHTRTVNKQLTGTSGTASVTGSITVSKTSADEGSTSEDVSATFENYSYNYYGGATYVSMANIMVDGTASLTSSATVSKGFGELCNAAVSGEPPVSDFAIAGEFHKQITGSFSISGQYGAAIAFTFSTDAAITEDGTTSGTFSGNASVKSGGKTVTCTVSGSLNNDTDSDGYKVICM